VPSDVRKDMPCRYLGNGFGAAALCLQSPGSPFAKLCGAQPQKLTEFSGKAEPFRTSGGKAATSVNAKWSVKFRLKRKSSRTRKHDRFSEISNTCCLPLRTFAPTLRSLRLGLLARRTQRMRKEPQRKTRLTRTYGTGRTVRSYLSSAKIFTP
jgi:hypothetical protein